MLQGRWAGPSGSLIALEMEFGWVLAGSAGHHPSATELVSHHVSLLSGDELAVPRIHCHCGRVLLPQSCKTSSYCVDLQKPARQVFYMPMHAVRKESSR